MCAFQLKGFINLCPESTLMVFLAEMYFCFKNTFLGNFPFFLHLNMFYAFLVFLTLFSRS